MKCEQCGLRVETRRKKEIFSIETRLEKELSHLEVRGDYNLDEVGKLTTDNFSNTRQIALWINRCVNCGKILEAKTYGTYPKSKK